MSDLLPENCITLVKCGLHRTYISSVERGERNIAIINLAKIAVALDIPLAQIFDGIDCQNDDS